MEGATYFFWTKMMPKHLGTMLVFLSLRLLVAPPICALTKGLDKLIEAYVLDSTPSLLSLGKRCMELGYRFVWEPFTHPKFFDPDGRRIAVEVINNIPYLVPSETEIVAGRTDLPRIYPALPAPIIHGKVVAAGELPDDKEDDEAPAAGSSSDPPQKPLSVEHPADMPESNGI